MSRATWQKGSWHERRIKAPKSKSQAPKPAPCVWDLEFGICLGFRAWSLELRSQPSLPLAQRFDVGSRAVAQPAVQLCLVLELLAAQARDNNETAVNLRNGGHVPPELFKLRYRENILLAVAPALLHVLERDVSGHLCGKRADGGGDFFVNRNEWRSRPGCQRGRLARVVAGAGRCRRAGRR